MNKTLTAAVAVGFLGCILAANYVTAEFGTVWVFGLTATAGTYFAGATFVLRDSFQDLTSPLFPRNRWLAATPTIGLIIVGSALSCLLAVTVFEADAGFLPPGVTPLSIAVASGIAFVASELADLVVYTPLRERGYLRAAMASNVVGSFIDTVLFLSIAGFGLASEVVAGQVLGKLAITALVVLAVRARRR